MHIVPRKRKQFSFIRCDAASMLVLQILRDHGVQSHPACLHATSMIIRTNTPSKIQLSNMLRIIVAYLFRFWPNRVIPIVTCFCQLIRLLVNTNVQIKCLRLSLAWRCFALLHGEVLFVVFATQHNTNKSQTIAKSRGMTKFLSIACATPTHITYMIFSPLPRLFLMTWINIFRYYKRRYLHSFPRITCLRLSIACLCFALLHVGVLFIVFATQHNTNRSQTTAKSRGMTKLLSIASATPTNITYVQHEHVCFSLLG